MRRVCTCSAKTEEGVADVFDEAVKVAMAACRAVRSGGGGESSQGKQRLMPV